MAHRRVKDVAYDDDELEDYDDTYEAEAEGTSAEDQEQLRQGTIAVREALGEDSDFTTDKEIHDSLWYYYYDVGKTVAYLQKQRRPEIQQQTPKKQKQATKFDQVLQSTQGSGVQGDSTTPSVPLWQCAQPFSSADFFADTPFLGVPQHRIGIIHEISKFPRGGLLGGSGTADSATKKPSKLAALAASRKKAAEEKRKAEAASTANNEVDNSLRMLDRLGKRQKTDDERTEEVRTQVQSLHVASTENAASNHLISNEIDSGHTSSPTRKRVYPKREDKPQVDTTESPANVVDVDMVSDTPIHETEVEKEDLRAMPSSFASSLFPNSLPNTTAFDHQYDSAQILSLPYSIPPDQIANHSPFSKPSPDDVVQMAQKGKAPKANKSSGGKQASDKDTTAGVANLRLDDSRHASGTSTPQKIKSKNLDIAAEYAKSDAKKSANFVVIGHVDHGKSTLMGRLLYDTGTHITQREFSRLSSAASAAGKASFSYAWLMDSTSEERARGITVDIAQTSFTTPDCDFTVLDAPGHKDFVPNMIAGASQADFAVLVVDASRGEFEKGLEGGGQTKEHALLIRGLGVGRVIVAVNKMDTVGWNEDRFQEVQGQMSAFLAKVGYKKDDVQCVPCAGLTGENVVFRRPPPPANESGKKSISKASKDTSSSKDTATQDPFPWYTGPTLLATLSNFAPSTNRHAALISQPLRLTISDIFRGGITNPLSISGRIDAGAVQVGDALIAMPAGQTCAVKGIDMDAAASYKSSGTDTPNPTQVDYAIAGQIATLHLAEIDSMHLRPGDVLCPAADPVKNIRTFTAKVLAFEHVVPGALDCHRGRLHCAATITKLVELVVGGSKGPAAEDGKRKRPRIVKPGQIAKVVVELEKALPVETGTRIVLRSEGTTVAAGLVESIEPVAK